MVDYIYVEQLIRQNVRYTTILSGGGISNFLTISPMGFVFLYDHIPRHYQPGQLNGVGCK